ncbi:MAG TPA: rRNA maturation RNase YbeY [Gammaproteobacteria bacterium]|nr:rRNA maturation RNase YbeY [Gammaproteobacteria bacterium]
MYRINIQSNLSSPPKAFVPTEAKLKKWAKAALSHKVKKAELTICLMGKKDIRKLNREYRNKDKATNVLSFRAELPPGVKLSVPLLGDIIICTPVVNEEAKSQDKTCEAHWAHMVIHGVLHLLGYDHEKRSEAELMETKEIKLLKSLGFPNPYIKEKA